MARPSRSRTPRLRSAANVPTGSGVSGNVVTDGNGNSTVYLQGATVADVLKAIDLATGVQTATNSQPARRRWPSPPGRRSRRSSSGALQIRTGTTADLAITGTGNALSALGLTGNTGTGTSFTAGRTAAPGSLSGKTLTFTSFNGGTAVNVTFGDGTNGTVKTLDQLNAALLANNLTATVDSTGKLTISTTNDYASSTLGSVAVGRRDRRHADQRDHLHDRVGSGGRRIGADRSQQPGDAVQRHPVADHHHRAGRVVQRHQPARRRSAQADVQRNRQVDAEHHRRHLQCGGSRPGEPDRAAPTSSTTPPPTRSLPT